MDAPLSEFDDLLFLDLMGIFQFTNCSKLPEAILF